MKKLVASIGAGIIETKPLEPKQMTLFFDDIDEVLFQIAGTGAASIDWGDGSTLETHTLTITDLPSAETCWRVYSEPANYSVVVAGENITHLICYEANLKSLDVSKNSALKELQCVNTQIKSLDLSKNMALENLFCLANQLTCLDVSKNTALKELGCTENGLSCLDVSKNLALTMLECDCNDLSHLDVSANIALTSLNCSNNELTHLDISRNSALTELICDGNHFSDQLLNELYALLPECDVGMI